MFELPRVGTVTIDGLMLNNESKTVEIAAELISVIGQSLKSFDTLRSTCCDLL